MTPAIDPSSAGDSSHATSAPIRRPMRPVRAVLRWLVLGPVWGLLGLVMVGMLLWATLAIRFADTHAPAGPRAITPVAFVLASLAAVLFIRPRCRYGLAAFALLFLLVLGWFFSLKPSNDRDWAPELARVPRARIDGDRVTLLNVRNFDYRTETDFTPRWEERVYDLSKVRTVDLMLVYWGSPDIAHAMVSFGFEDGQYLAVSIETRKERTESYSTIEGFFRQYELIYIFADERDVVRLRTNYRKDEEVYLYHTTLTPAQARAALESYLHRANALADHPEFYNALTSNCANNVLEHARAGGQPGKFTWNIVLSGRAARQGYDNGGLDRSLPFEELQRRSNVNAAARAADQDLDFSKRIRVGLPIPASVAAGSSAKPAPSATTRTVP